MKKVYSYIVLCALTAALFLYIILMLYIKSPGPLQRDTIFLFLPKTPIRALSSHLNQKNIINYPLLFNFIAKVVALKYPLKSGEYYIPKYSSPYQILQILHKGKSIIHKLTIVEGKTLHEIIKQINNIDNLSGIISLNIKEGYLLPAVYYYFYNDDRNKMLRHINNSMHQILDQLSKQLNPNSPIKNEIELLTLASIIEKESFLEEEKPIIASVFLNRLKKNIPLQADPTVIYAITNGMFKLNRPLTKADLQIESPYNTYKNLGLPPGPICIPSISSMQAVITPSETDFLYFVLDENNYKHNFSNNLSQHNLYVKKYRKFQTEKYNRN